MYKCITYVVLITALYTVDLRASSLRISNLTTGDSSVEDVTAGMTMAIKYSIGDSLKIEWNRPSLNYWSVNESGVGFRGYQYQPYKHLEKALDSSSFSIAGAILVGGVSINGTTTSTTSYSFSDPSNHTYPQEINPIVFVSLSPPPTIPNYSFSFVAMQKLPYQMAIVSSASAESAVQTSEGMVRTPSGQPGWEWDYQRMWSKSQDFYSGSEAISFALIPEPSALSLLAVGLGGLAMMRRRRS